MVRKYQCFVIPCLVILLIGGLFFNRSGVYILSDEAELLVYGTNRALWHTIKAGISLFRPIHILTMPETKDVELQLSTLTKKVSPQGTIITPFRYEQVVEIFQSRHSKAKVIMWGRDYAIDYQRDLKRAAAIAGTLAADTSLPPALVLPSFIDDASKEHLKKAFDEGLLENGYNQVSLLIKEPNETPPSCSSITLFPGAVTVQKFSVPIVLFSSIKDALLPQSVTAVFDDSLWPHIVEMIVYNEKNIKINLMSALRTKNVPEKSKNSADN